MACAPSKDSDQPGHLLSLIRVFAVCMKKAGVLSYPLSAQRRLWSDWVDGCPGWSESSLGAHSFCWFCHVAAQMSVPWLTKRHWFNCLVAILWFSYRKFPKYLDTQKLCCNHSKIWSMWLYHRVMSPNDADEMANSAVWSGSALFAQAYLSENLGSLWYCLSLWQASWIHPIMWPIQYTCSNLKIMKYIIGLRIFSILLHVLL